MPRKAFSKPPLCSSREIIAALECCGAYPSKAGQGGSHLSFHRRINDQVATTVVVLNKKEVPKRILRNNLDNLGISLQEFLDAL